MNIAKFCLECREKLRLWMLASVRGGLYDTGDRLEGLKEMPLLCECCLAEMIKESNNAHKKRTRKIIQ